jgi:hypothetical protein
MNGEKSGIARPYYVTVEDDNGVYFLVYVVAVNPDDATSRVSHLLNDDAARITGVQV